MLSLLVFIVVLIRKKTQKHEQNKIFTGKPSSSNLNEDLGRWVRGFASSANAELHPFDQSCGAVIMLSQGEFIWSCCGD